MTTAFQSDAFQTTILAFQIDSTPTVVTTDTHDGFDANRKRDEEALASRERLKYMLNHAIDPQAYPWPIPEPEVLELADEFVERAESGFSIDWERLERENIIRARLYALAEEFERKRIEFEQDEEDVMLLLLH